MVMTLLTTFAIPLNSALNTVIYFCRIKDLRTFALSVLHCNMCNIICNICNLNICRCRTREGNTGDGKKGIELTALQDQ